MNIRYFNIAREISKLSPFKKIKLGCVVVYKKDILSVGYNSYKTNPLMKELDKERYDVEEDYNYHCHSLHAEVSALIKIRHLDIDFKKVIVYTYRESRTGALRMSRPCKSCAKLIRDLGIRKMCYSTDTGYAEEILSDNSKI